MLSISGATVVGPRRLCRPCRLPRQSVRWRPAAREVPVYPSVRSDGCRRRPILCDIERLTVRLLENLAEIGSPRVLLHPVGEVGGLVGVMPDVDGIDSWKGILPVVPERGEAAEDHRIDGREVGPLVNPDRAQEEVHVVILPAASLAIAQVSDDVSCAADRSEMDVAAIVVDDLMVVR